MDRQSIIAQKLSVLKPQFLRIINDSNLHHGHESSPNSGESHFTVEIMADSIKGKRLIEQHKIINELLKEEFEQGLHALSIKIKKG
jgi:BolA protein